MRRRWASRCNGDGTASESLHFRRVNGTADGAMVAVRHEQCELLHVVLLRRERDIVKATAEVSVAVLNQGWDSQE